jgi:hypothetical protein
MENLNDLFVGEDQLEKQEENFKILEHMMGGVNPLALGQLLASEGMHRTLQQNFMRLAVSFIAFQAQKKDKGNFDARNADTVKLASKMLACVESRFDLFLPYV